MIDVWNLRVHGWCRIGFLGLLSGGTVALAALALAPGSTLELAMLGLVRLLRAPSGVVSAARLVILVATSLVELEI